MLRVAGSRVTGDVLVSAFEAVQTPGEILQQYPTLDLQHYLRSARLRSQSPRNTTSITDAVVDLISMNAGLPWTRVTLDTLYSISGE